MGRGSAEGRDASVEKRGKVKESDLVLGSRWRHPRFRDTWKLESAGEKLVTLKPNLPFLKRQRIPREEFLASDWYRV